MRNTSKILLAACCLSSTLLTGCIDEVAPTDSATGGQVETSPKALEALLYGMPAYMNKFGGVFGDDADAYAYDFGYGSMMHIRDVMTEDFAVTFHGYDWYTTWEFNLYLAENYISAQLVWQYYTKLVQTTNKVIGAVDANTADDLKKGYLGAGYAFRAFVYLDMARMYEFLENDGTESVNSYGNDVLNYTVPIVTEETTEEDSRNNPRVKREDMFEFIKSDLDLAEEYIVFFNRPIKTLPDLAAVYGLKARLYMWVEDYENAKLYARKAIDLGKYTPTTKEQWLSTTSGFNDISTPSWIWGSQMVEEDAVVQSGIINWTAWSSNEAVYGYCGVGPYNCIGAAIYNKIDNDDFRKLSFKAPEGSFLDGKIPYIDEEVGESLPVYAAIKFRPGSGDGEKYKVGSACSYPIMRIEEMYFIEAEAAAHLDANEGKNLLEDFMKKYRYSSYICKATDMDGVVDEIFLQKRIEFWGEGLNYFDYKRLNKPVTRLYEGTNFAQDAQMNTTTRPAWMNFVIVRSEGNNNKAVAKWNNPDPTDCY